MTVKPAIIIGLALLGLLLGIDVYLASDSVRGNTWSEILRTWAKATPITSWAAGVLIGHWFHPYDNFRAVLDQPASIILLVWSSLLLLSVGIALRTEGIIIPLWIPPIVGFFAGWLLWPV